MWSGGPEKGEKKIAQPAFYITRGGLSVEAGLLAMALLRNPAHSLPLLPEGEGRLEKVGAARITAGGKPRDLTLYLMTGLASPIYVWMDGAGVFFGRYDGFITSVPQGCEDAAAAMIKAQLEAEASRWKAEAVKLSHRPAGALVLKGARLFDPEAGTVTPNVTVVVSGNRIQAVGADGQVPVPAGAEVVDAHGRMLLPGLWDMHQHFTEDDGLLDLAAGVTTGRDMANDMDYLLGLKQKWDSGDALGPRVVLAGVIEGPGPYASPTKVLVDTDEKARAAVDHYIEKGYEQIKIYSSLDPKLVPGIVAEAHRHGLRVSGHIPFGMTAADAVRDGYDELQHINFLFLNFIPGVDTRTMARMTAVGEHAAEIDLTSEPVRAFIRLLKERHTVVDPTLNIYEDLFTARADELRPSLAPVADRLPYQVRRTLFGGSLAIPPGQEQRYRDSYRACVAMVRLLHDEGIPIVAGTDSFAGFDLHRELELYVGGGPPGARGAAHRDPGSRPGDEARPGPRHHRPRQARRPDPGGRRPDAEHQRHPAGRPDGQERRDVRPGRAVPVDRLQAGGVTRIPGPSPAPAKTPPFLSGDPPAPARGLAGPSGRPAGPGEDLAGPSGRPAGAGEDLAGPSGRPAGPGEDLAGPSADGPPAPAKTSPVVSRSPPAPPRRSPVPGPTV